MHRVVKYLHARRNDGDWIDLNKNHPCSSSSKQI